MISPDRVVGVLLDVMARRRDELVEHAEPVQCVLGHRRRPGLRAIHVVAQAEHEGVGMAVAAVRVWRMAEHHSLRSRPARPAAPGAPTTSGPRGDQPPDGHLRDRVPGDAAHSGKPATCRSACKPSRAMTGTRKSPRRLPRRLQRHPLIEARRRRHRPIRQPGPVHVEGPGGRRRTVRRARD